MISVLRPRRRRAPAIESTLLAATLALAAAITTASVTSASVGTTSGTSVARGIRLASYADGNPIGVVDTMVRVSGGLLVGGWTYDPDDKRAPLRAFATVDGKRVSNMIADRSRPDVATAHPSAGALHGFGWHVSVPEGAHTVCVGANNLDRGADAVLGCRSTTFDYGPIGAIEALTTSPGHLHLRGWAVDRDALTSPVGIGVSIGATVHRLTANAARPALAAIPPAAGDDHGYHATYPVAQGRHTVCITATNIGIGSDNSLGCRTIAIDDSPLSRIQAVTTSGNRVRVGGWAYDEDDDSAALTILIRIDGVPHRVLANRRNRLLARSDSPAGPDHGYYLSVPALEGTHSICVVARNIGFGSDVIHRCRTVTLNFTPTAVLSTLTATPTGALATGWAADPDTTSPISLRVRVDGRSRVIARAWRTPHGHHGFAVSLPMHSGTHTVCATALNVGYGTANSAPSCRTLTLALSPIGRFESLTRSTGSSDLALAGWSFDPDTTRPISMSVTVDGGPARTFVANAQRDDVATMYPSAGARHGLVATVVADAGEHQVCVTATDVRGGSDTSLGCRTIDAVNPTVPAQPAAVSAVPGYGGATVSWLAPTSDGGAPWSGYTVTASPGGAVATVGPTATSATVTGLRSGRTYTFSVVARNVEGNSPAGVSPALRTQTGPPPQRTPAPVSTSRYIRNISGSSATDLATMRSEGYSDARANPSGHGYLILLDIGGQDEYDGGVVLSAGVRFVTYSDLVRCLQAYTDGYHAGQRASAPVTVALGTNNDIDVSTSSGKNWAGTVVNPVASHTRGYAGMTIAGADDIEPGFRASYAQTRRWLNGYLAATTAPFIFNGSADGCAWSYPNGSCNNGWTMSALDHLAVGAAPTRLLDLPQIYNTTMSHQWKYISLTGVVNGSARIDFAGPLTEYTACQQAGSCGSISGRSAWSLLWSDLQSDSRLKVNSLPYSTDLRIDR